MAEVKNKKNLYQIKSPSAKKGFLLAEVAGRYCAFPQHGIAAIQPNIKKGRNIPVIRGCSKSILAVLFRKNETEAKTVRGFEA